MNQKGFANIILIILIVILAGAVGYFALVNKPSSTEPQNKTLPTSDNDTAPQNPAVSETETANWKVYTNNKYGFEVKYPPDWQAPILNDSTVSNGQPSVNVSFPLKNSDIYAVQLVNVTIFIPQGSTEKNISAFMQSYKMPWEKQISINNGKAFYYVNNSSKAGPTPTAYFVGPSSVWLMSTEEVSLKDTFLKMVSSFSFLSSTATNQNWKIYTNPKYGFQLTLTDAWKGYKVDLEPMGSNFGAGTLVFKVPTKDKNYGDGSGYAPPMKISIYQPEYWSMLQKGDGPKPQLLGKSADGWVLAVWFWQDPPADLQNVNFEFQKVVDSFKLIK